MGRKSSTKRRRKIHDLVCWISLNVTGAVRHIPTNTPHYINNFRMGDGQEYILRLIKNEWSLAANNVEVLRTFKETAIQSYVKTIGLLFPKTIAWPPIGRDEYLDAALRGANKFGTIGYLPKSHHSLSQAIQSYAELSYRYPPLPEPRKLS